MSSCLPPLPPACMPRGRPAKQKRSERRLVGKAAASSCRGALCTEREAQGLARRKPQTEVCFKGLCKACFRVRYPALAPVKLPRGAATPKTRKRLRGKAEASACRGPGCNDRAAQGLVRRRARPNATFRGFCMACFRVQFPDLAAVQLPRGAATPKPRRRLVGKAEASACRGAGCTERVAQGLERRCAQTNAKFRGLCKACFRVRYPALAPVKLPSGAATPRPRRRLVGKGPLNACRGPMCSARHAEGGVRSTAQKGASFQGLCKACVRARFPDAACTAFLDNQAYTDVRCPTHSCTASEGGIFDKCCGDCGAYYFHVECGAGSRCNLCCGHGRAKDVPRVADAPRTLTELLGEPHFRENIRRYNAAMSFAEQSGQPQRHLPGIGPPVYVLHGQAYHGISTLLPSSDRAPSHGQLYIYDPQEAAQRRVQWDEGLRNAHLVRLHNMRMRDVSPPNRYAQGYKHMHERMLEQQRAGHAPDVALRLRSGQTPDPRRYNAPSAEDIAVVFPGTHPPSSRDITVYLQADEACGDTHAISHLSEHVDPLTYPLLFPKGDKGWCPDLRIPWHMQNGNPRHDKLQLCEFYSQRMMIFDVARSSLPHAGGVRLFQQYVVDAYAKVEGQRLDWVYRNQDKLRIGSLQGLMDFTGIFRSESDSTPGGVPA